MATYRLCFLNDDGRLLEERVIRAPRNYEAAMLSKRLAAGVPCAAYEVWSNRRRIVRETPRQRVPPTAPGDALAEGAHSASALLVAGRRRGERS